VEIRDDLTRRKAEVVEELGRLRHMGATTCAVVCCSMMDGTSASW
jgi:hypothetical protein